MATKYTFETTSAYDFHPHHEPKLQSHHRRHRRSASASSDQQSDHHSSGGGDPIDCSGSLTYSATSSVNSGCGESTDSSFADIMKVLEIQDGTNLASYLRGGSSFRRDEKSVAAESLAYSTDADTYLRSLATDADSHLHGTELLSQANLSAVLSDTKFQQPSGEREDAANAAADPFADNIFFAPAEHTESIKQRKERKRQERLQRRAAKAQQAASPSTPRTSIHVGTRSQPSPQAAAAATSPRYSQSLASGEDSSQWESRQEATPPPSAAPSPRPPKSRTSSSRGAAASSQDRRKGGRNGNGGDEDEDDEDVWYAKWWMFCFPDAVRNMTERR